MVAPSDPLGLVFRALGHPVRRRLLDLLKAEPGANVGVLAAGFEMSRIAVMKHLRVLEDADLVVSIKEGRERRLYFNVVPIQRIYDRWTSEYSAWWARRLTEVKYRVEAAGDETPDPKEN